LETATIGNRNKPCNGKEEPELLYIDIAEDEHTYLKAI
jgi:hypothetical protein